MPRLKESLEERKDSAIRGAIARCMAEQGLNDQEMGICIMATRRTFQNKKKKPNTFTLGDIRRMDSKLKFTEQEIIAMIRGK